ncbi:hypothetical protein PPERSA_04451 [Pseudocohnilembus persalinus]|uniref:Uncharacterized protein n=1 Tax=Pseudocohnilembus persalinus TaxID=266149 RepID=A0A0V0QR09_PSEPJ|nr:hypothetical protein PPERSA_04451 [Pseudocohnilembus persalinus]|eukprot:KRX04636.1 hypothetical protein PPERSA_04451 [Pseudocohnilembus persalinus]
MFDGWSENYNRWYCIHSENIKPLRSVSIGYTGQRSLTLREFEMDEKLIKTAVNCKQDYSHIYQASASKFYAGYEILLSLQNILGSNPRGELFYERHQQYNILKIIVEYFLKKDGLTYLKNALKLKLQDKSQDQRRVNFNMFWPILQTICDIFKKIIPIQEYQKQLRSYLIVLYDYMQDVLKNEEFAQFFDNEFPFEYILTNYNKNHTQPQDGEGGSMNSFTIEKDIDNNFQFQGQITDFQYQLGQNNIEYQKSQNNQITIYEEKIDKLETQMTDIKELLQNMNKQNKEFQKQQKLLQFQEQVQKNKQKEQEQKQQLTRKDFSKKNVSLFKHQTFIGNQDEDEIQIEEINSDSENEKNGQSSKINKQQTNFQIDKLIVELQNINMRLQNLEQKQENMQKNSENLNQNQQINVKSFNELEKIIQQFKEEKSILNLKNPQSIQDLIGLLQKIQPVLENKENQQLIQEQKEIQNKDKKDLNFSIYFNQENFMDQQLYLEQLEFLMKSKQYSKSSQFIKWRKNLIILEEILGKDITYQIAVSSYPSLEINIDDILLANINNLQQNQNDLFKEQIIINNEK